jgi:hypothetical protein
MHEKSIKALRAYLGSSPLHAGHLEIFADWACKT